MRIQSAAKRRHIVHIQNDRPKRGTQIVFHATPGRAPTRHRQIDCGAKDCQSSRHERNVNALSVAGIQQPFSRRIFPQQSESSPSGMS